MTFSQHHSTSQVLDTNPELLSTNTSKAIIINTNTSYYTIHSCLYEAIVNSNSIALVKSLSSTEKAFYCKMLSLFQTAQKQTLTTPSAKLAEMLGYEYEKSSDMRSIALKLTKELETKGFLKVVRCKNRGKKDEINEIMPLLPDDLFEEIKNAPSQFGQETDRKAGESNLDYILRTKLFVPIDSDVLKAIFKSSMTANFKLFVIHSYITAYKNYQATGELSFSATSKDLMKKTNISQRTVFRILKDIKSQNPNNFIKLEHNYMKSDDIDSNRFDKSVFKITFDPLTLPSWPGVTKRAESEKNTTLETSWNKALRLGVPKIPPY